MGTNTNTTVALDRCLASPPEKINIPPDADQEILTDFIESTMSGLEKLEGSILSFDSGQITCDDFVTTAQRILHNMKGESGIMDFAEISVVCHHAESLLYENSKTIPVNTLFSIKDWLTKAIQYLAKTCPELSEHIFTTQSSKILDSAQIDLFDLGHGTTDAQAVKSLLSKMAKITELTAQIGNVEVKALAKKAIDLLRDIQNAEQCIISDVHKESLFDLIDGLHKATGNEL
jgi:chemotaxis protein histidine kinase CheA